MNLDRNLKIIDPRITPIANFELTIKICELIVKCDKFKVVKKGANETTKCIINGTAEIVILAADTEPLEIINHIPLSCETNKIPYIFLSSKIMLGRACGISRSVISCVILNSTLNHIRKEIFYIKNIISEIIV
ncbi:60S ribosomal protein L7AE (nucleomorph) [Lotharella oceanica]|uniref:H/ACA ribonucleoprotein complex subunit 2 n=1 Tax=Lotharella oceanica TaxID=641309 RepID=A0A060DGY6_9EUKA|nr:60S ribosomal protein L7AE [Lotharella oceanica]|mmetsp:Transcript_19436/g.36599  ORF Transcript_19436/g.36599 Transcript_19436/m.36599 type:complete len:133 (+) Transcript_19436:1001-1399(+)